jgi:ADP-ribose pyrophosphatase
MNEKPETWTRTASDEIADCRVFKVRRDHSKRAADDAEHTFFCLESPDWVNVIPLTREDKVVLIHQYRHGAEEITLEIPGGMVDAGETPQEAAVRELAEESGYIPREIVFLGRTRPNPAIQNNWMHHFLALDCEKTSETLFDAHESVVTELFDLKEIPQLFRDERITHSLVLACFHKFELFRDKNI